MRLRVSPVLIQLITPEEAPPSVLGAFSFDSNMTRGEVLPTKRVLSFFFKTFFSTLFPPFPSGANTLDLF